MLLLRFFCAGAAPGDGLGGSEGGDAVDAADGGGEHQMEDAEADERDAEPKPYGDCAYQGL